ncbi:MAG: M28 family peptidase [Saprospiraceae bacterium]|nr:M28 family peptidase [Saprospiraceae bacterium]
MNTELYTESNRQWPRWLLFFLVLFISTDANSQMDGQSDAFMIRAIYDDALTQSSAYDWLTHLSEEIGGRLAGSPESIEAVGYTSEKLRKLGSDSVWQQPCMVPRWQRKGPEKVVATTSNGETFEVPSTTLGNSEGGKATGEIIEVHTLEEVDSLGPDVIAGKIVFYNRPMDPTHVRTFWAYGGAVDQRGRGPAVASRNGAVGCLVRSMTTRLDDVPHSGMTRYYEKESHIPSMAISTNAADRLSDLLDEGPVTVSMENYSRLLPDTMSYSVIAEIKGSVYPDSILLVGGHLDSWDLGGGAHDDGAGCVQSMAVLEIFKNLGYKPRHTLRCVLFMNEENGLGGALTYADSSRSQGLFHLAALESDSGGFTPRGFRADGHEDVLQDKFKTMYSWLPLLEPYGLTMSVGGSGADVGRLKDEKGLLLGLRTDSQRYFDYHHTTIDRIQAVNKRELELGAAAMASLIYLIDQHGI